MDLRTHRMLLQFIMAIGIILILDELWVWGIPFGGFLGDLSRYDPTKSPLIHHWMLGIALFVVGAVLYSRTRHMQ